MGPYEGLSTGPGPVRSCKEHSTSGSHPIVHVLSCLKWRDNIGALEMKKHRNCEEVLGSVQLSLELANAQGLHLRMGAWAKFVVKRSCPRC